MSEQSLEVITAESLPVQRESTIGSETSSESNMLAVIERAAANPAIDVDKMERLLSMQERIMAKVAEQKFNAAMSAAQQEMPRVGRDAHNPSTNSLYTRLETLNDAAVPIYTKHGFSLSFGTADCPTPDYFRITCHVSHDGGHSRDYQCDLPNDCVGAKGNASKTKMHGAGSTFSYGRRYLTLLIFNITLVNEDDDGNRGNRPKPQGPSTIAGDGGAKELARELWAVLKPVRGEKSEWATANQWLWKMEITDGAIPEEVPHLTPKRFREVIEKAKAALAHQ